MLLCCCTWYYLLFFWQHTKSTSEWVVCTPPAATPLNNRPRSNFCSKTYLSIKNQNTQEQKAPGTRCPKVEIFTEQLLLLVSSKTKPQQSFLLVTSTSLFLTKKSPLKFRSIPYGEPITFTRILGVSFCSASLWLSP